MNDMDVPTETTSLPLPDDVNVCHAMIRQLLEAQGKQQRMIDRMEHQLADLLRRLYGRSSEKIDPAQLPLFGEQVEQLRRENDIQPPPEQPSPASSTKNTNGHGRRKLPADLPRTRVVHDLPESQRACPCCGEMRQEIGQETSEQLEYEPAKLSVIEHVRIKYACRACEQSAAESGPQIVTAEKPLMAIEKGLAGPGLIAHVMVSKYDDHLPLNRLERILKRHGIDISRSTMWGWVAQATDPLERLVECMITRMLKSKVIWTDDTPVDVQDRDRPKAMRTGRFWVYLGDEDHPYTVYSYTPNRSRAGPMEFLKDWGRDEQRYMQADAFGGYDGIYAGLAGGQVIEVACWAHARRKFHDARKSDYARSSQALAMIRVLYDVEAEAREMTSPERALLRQKKSQPILKEFKTWLDSQQAPQGGVLPKSPMGEAITYAMNQWEALQVYISDGDLSIDNNVAERALRQIAVGRKNWLFLGGDNGGRAAAIAFSLLATCRRHNVEPLSYLRDVLTRISSWPTSRLAELLPDRWKPGVSPSN